MTERYVSRSYKFGKAPNDEINAEIARLKGAGYELVSFEDDRTTNNLYFGFKLVAVLGETARVAKED